MPSAFARRITASLTRIASASDMLMLRRLKVSVAAHTSATVVTPASTARSYPFSLGTSAS